MSHDLNSYIVGRLLLAFLLGGAVGLERELRHKAAGLRTNMLICFGAALFTIISQEMGAHGAGEDTRIASQIIPGIGFIGAGAVIRDRGSVTGITSAATIFVMASIGMAVGAGMVVSAIFATALLLVTLVGLGIAEDRLGLHKHLINFRISVAGGAPDAVRRVVDEAKIIPERWQVTKTDAGLTVEFNAEVTTPQERDLLAKLGSAHDQCATRTLRE